MRAEQSTTTPTHRYFTYNACGGCGFLALKREYYNPRKFLLRALEPFCENVHPRKISAISVKYECIDLYGHSKIHPCIFTHCWVSCIFTELKTGLFDQQLNGRTVLESGEAWDESGRGERGRTVPLTNAPQLCLICSLPADPTRRPNPVTNIMVVSEEDDTRVGYFGHVIWTISWQHPTSKTMHAHKL